MKTNLKQAFTLVTSLVLLVTFYIILVADLLNPFENFLTQLILIILAIIGLAIYSEIINMGKMLSEFNKGGRK